MAEDGIQTNKLKLGPQTNCKLLKLIAEIKSKEVTIINLLCCLNIFNNIGVSRLNSVFSNCNSLVNDIKNDNIIIENLTSIPGINVKIAKELKRGFEYFNSHLSIYKKYFNIVEE